MNVVVRAGSRHRVEVSAPGFKSTRLDVAAAEPGAERRERAALVPVARAPVVDIAFDSRELIWFRITGPDGARLAVPFRVLDDRERLTPTECLDQSDDVTIHSAARTALSGATRFRRPLEGEPPITIELGGGLLETRRVLVAPPPTTFGRTDAESVRLVLHAR